MIPLNCLIRLYLCDLSYDLISSHPTVHKICPVLENGITINTTIPPPLHHYHTARLAMVISPIPSALPAEQRYLNVNSTTTTPYTTPSPHHHSYTATTITIFTTLISSPAPLHHHLTTFITRIPHKLYYTDNRIAAPHRHHHQQQTQESSMAAAVVFTALSIFPLQQLHLCWARIFHA